MHPRQRYVILAIVALGLLLGAVVGHGLTTALVWAQYPNPQLWDRQELSVAALGGYAVAALVVALCLRQGTARTFAMQVGDELARVNWPSREQTRHATWVVLWAVAMCALFLGVLDGCWLWLTNVMMGTA